MVLHPGRIAGRTVTRIVLDFVLIINCVTFGTAGHPAGGRSTERPYVRRYVQRYVRRYVRPNVRPYIRRCGVSNRRGYKKTRRCLSYTAGPLFNLKYLLFQVLWND